MTINAIVMGVTHELEVWYDMTSPRGFACWFASGELDGNVLTVWGGDISGAVAQWCFCTRWPLPDGARGFEISREPAPERKP